MSEKNNKDLYISACDGITPPERMRERLEAKMREALSAERKNPTESMESFNFITDTENRRKEIKYRNFAQRNGKYIAIAAAFAIVIGAASYASLFGGNNLIALDNSKSAEAALESNDGGIEENAAVEEPEFIFQQTPPLSEDNNDYITESAIGNALTGFADKKESAESEEVFDEEMPVEEEAVEECETVEEDCVDNVTAETTSSDDVVTARAGCTYDVLGTTLVSSEPLSLTANSISLSENITGAEIKSALSESDAAENPSDIQNVTMYTDVYGNSSWTADVIYLYVPQEGKSVLDFRLNGIGIGSAEDEVENILNIDIPSDNYDMSRITVQYSDDNYVYQFIFRISDEYTEYVLYKRFDIDGSGDVFEEPD